MLKSKKSLSVSQLASATRSDRVMVALPGVKVTAAPLSQEACQVYAELKSIDSAEGMLSFLKVLG